MAPIEMSQPSNAQYMKIPTQDMAYQPLSKWQNGLCGCTADCGTFCLSFFCPCIQYGLNAERVYNNEHFFLNCCFYGMLEIFGFGCFLGAANRQNIRQRAKINVILVFT
jgi:Cys-rich protein (TIGR01571 family)